ncbi:hypothetical protein ACEN9J_13610 [Variovorax sp. Varisp41]
MLTSERLRLAQAVTVTLARPSIQRVIEFQHRHAQLAHALASVRGIGAASVAVPQAELPELGKLDRRRIAAGAAWRP